MQNPDIKKLESIFDADQDSLKEFREGKITLEMLKDVMLRNQKYVANHIARLGFPFKKLTSKKAYKAAFLTILHSGDANMMEDILARFKAAEDDQIEKKDIAFLTDKARVLKGLNQIYGTQYKTGKDGEIEFLPIEDEAHVDERRAALGMEPLSKYKETAEAHS